MVENRNGLLVGFTVRPTCGPGCSEPEVADEQLDELADRGFDPQTVGADKGFHTKDFVTKCRDKGTEPHVARVAGRRTPGLDGRHARSARYRQSQRLRKRVEKPFGWMKTVGMFRKSRWIGVAATDFVGQFIAASCNLIRMAKLALQGSDPPATQAAAA